MKYPPRKCAYCEQEFIPERRNRKFCSDTCKQYNYLTKKTGKRYGIDNMQLVERASHEAQPLIISQEASDTPSVVQKPPEISITYEYLGKSPQGHPPKSIALRSWFSTITG